MNRKRFMIASIAMIVSFAVAGTLCLYGQEEYEPAPGPGGVDVQRSQVYVTGTGYEIDKQRKKTHKEEEQKKEEIEKKEPKPEKNKSKSTANPASVKKIKNNKSTASKEADKSKPEKKTNNKKDPTKKKEKPNPDDPGGGGDEPSEEERARKPVIKTDIASGERVDGRRIDFSVTVTNYKKRNVPVFSESDGSFTLVFNGQQIYSTGSSGNKTYFREPLAEGGNEIYVTAVDREGNTSAKTIRFTANTSAETEVTGRVNVSIEAPVLNLGVIYSTTIQIHAGDTAKDVLEEAFNEAGITPSFSGGYLVGISRPGITNGAFISDEIIEEMEERGVTEKKHDSDSLKEFDFYDSSGWKYMVNGAFPDQHPGSYKMYNRDVMTLVFQLAEGIY